MKKKLTFGLSFIILFVVTLTAQNPADFTGSLLWKITGNDLKTPSYVFGSYHLLGKELMDEVPGLKHAFETTAQVIGEVDMADMGAMQAKVMQAGMLPAGESYKTQLSEDEYARLDAGLKSLFGAGLEQLGILKPGMISAQLAVVLCVKTMPEINPMTLEAIDAYLQRMARENGKAVKGLETVEEQVEALFHSDGLKTDMLSLLCTVESADFAMAQLKKMTADYRNGALYPMYVDSFENENDPCRDYNTQSKKDVLLKNRNDNWMGKLPALMSGQASLIVVGAAHLAGEEGILYQLSKKGYKVEAVR